MINCTEGGSGQRGCAATPVGPGGGAPQSHAGCSAALAAPCLSLSGCQGQEASPAVLSLCSSPRRAPPHLSSETAWTPCGLGSTVLVAVRASEDASVFYVTHSHSKAAGSATQSSPGVWEGRIRSWLGTCARGGQRRENHSSSLSPSSCSLLPLPPGLSWASPAAQPHGR